MKKLFQILLLICFFLEYTTFSTSIQRLSLDDRCKIPFLKIILNLDPNPTSNRVEGKLATSEIYATSFIAALQKYFGDRLNLRDTPPPGKIFLTVTDIYGIENPNTVVEIDVNTPEGVKKVKTEVESAKVRVRHYLVASRDGKTPPVRAGITADRKKLELKFKVFIGKKPDVEASKTERTMKAWHYGSDDDIEVAFHSLEALEAHKKEIFKNSLVLQGDKGNPEIMRQLLETIKALHHARNKAADGSLPFTRIQYERASYQIFCKNVKTGELIPIQITVDRNIVQLDPKTNRIIHSLDGVVTVEIKVPESFELMSRNQLRSVSPELYYLTQEFTKMDAIPGSEPGKGKYYTIRTNQQLSRP